MCEQQGGWAGGQGRLVGTQGHGAAALRWAMPSHSQAGAPHVNASAPTLSIASRPTSLQSSPNKPSPTQPSPPMMMLSTKTCIIKQLKRNQG